MKVELRNAISKEKTNNLENRILYDLFIGIVNKPLLICLFGFYLKDLKLKLSYVICIWHMYMTHFFTSSWNFVLYLYRDLFFEIINNIIEGFTLFFFSCPLNFKLKYAFNSSNLSFILLLIITLFHQVNKAMKMECS